MPLSRLFLFQGNSLVIPESTDKGETPNGVARDKADMAFGKPDFYTVPAIGTTGPVAAVLLRDDFPVPSGWRLLPVREALTTADRQESRRLLRSYHIIQWRNDSVYCGSCGERNGDLPNEPARLCPRCGRIEFPRISPAVIVLITDSADSILLAHNSKFRDKMYSIIAGFAEAGESLEDAAHREIKEELNITVKDLRYVRSQSWPFPNSLMVGFTALYAEGELQPDGGEITDARWFTREEIRQNIVDIPGPGSISRFLIDEWFSKQPLL